MQTIHDNLVIDTSESIIHIFDVEKQKHYILECENEKKQIFIDSLIDLTDIYIMNDSQKICVIDDHGGLRQYNIKPATGLDKFWKKMASCEEYSQPQVMKEIENLNTQTP